MDCPKVSKDSDVHSKGHGCKNIVHLWEFLLELLATEKCSTVITWTRKEHREFRIQNPQLLAKKWGAFKKKGELSYENLSRSLRYYYRSGIINKVPGKRLEYRFNKMPYKYEPGVTRSLTHGQRIKACIGEKEPMVTNSRYHDKILKSPEHQKPRLTESRQCDDWVAACFLHQEHKNNHVSPFQTSFNSAFTPFSTSTERTKPSLFKPSALRSALWCPDPKYLAPQPSKSVAGNSPPEALDIIEFEHKPVQAVQPGNPVTPAGAIEKTASSIRVSVIKKI